MSAFNPTEQQVRAYLIEDNGWTDEEWNQFAGYHFRYINADGSTTITRDMWTRLAEEFS